MLILQTLTFPYGEEISGADFFTPSDYDYPFVGAEEALVLVLAWVNLHMNNFQKLKSHYVGNTLTSKE